MSTSDGAAAAAAAAAGAGTSSSSTTFENPWESVSNDHSYKKDINNNNDSSQQQEGTTYTSRRLHWSEETQPLSNHDIIEERTDNNTNRQDNNHHTSFCGTFWNGCYNTIMNCSFGHLLSMIDMSLSLILLIYVGYTIHYTKTNNQDPTITLTIIQIISLLIAIMIICRIIMTTFTCCDISQRRCSKSSTRFLTLSLCTIYGILAFVTWIVISEKPNHGVLWCQTLGRWCHDTPKAIPTILVVLTLIEVLRYIYWQGQLTQYDQDHPSSNVNTTRQRHASDDDDNVSYTRSRRNSPWWWNRQHHNNRDNNNELNESLLGLNGQPGWSNSNTRHDQSYSVDDGITTPRRRRGLFSTWFGSQSNNDNVRDDGSVDYESLNEEWASRSEEDPYWWTRNEQNNNNT